MHTEEIDKTKNVITSLYDIQTGNEGERKIIQEAISSLKKLKCDPWPENSMHLDFLKNKTVFDYIDHNMKNHALRNKEFTDFRYPTDDKNLTPEELKQRTRSIFAMRYSNLVKEYAQSIEV